MSCYMSCHMSYYKSCHMSCHMSSHIIISLFTLENNAHCLKSLYLVSTDYVNS